MEALDYILAVYAACCIIGFGFSIIGMKSASETRELNRSDVYASIFFTISGFFGTIVILCLLIPVIYRIVRANRLEKELRDVL